MHIIGIRHQEQNEYTKETSAPCSQVPSQSRRIKKKKTIQHRHITPIFQLCLLFSKVFSFFFLFVFFSSLLEYFEVLLLFLINIFLIICLFHFSLHHFAHWKFAYKMLSIERIVHSRSGVNELFHFHTKKSIQMQSKFFCKSRQWNTRIFSFFKF